MVRTFFPLLMLLVWMPVADASFAGRRAAKAKAAPAFQKNDFDALEAQIAALRAQPFDFFDLWANIDGFYYGMEPPKGSTNDQLWQQHRQKLEAWLAAKPDSTAARIALMDWWIAYAWKARGTGWANTVKEEDCVLMRERLTKALTYAAEIDHDTIDDPSFFRHWLTASHALPMEDADINAIFTQAKARFPGYHGLYRAHGYFLLPKWGGKADSIDQLAREVAEQHPVEAERDSIYFVIASIAMEENPQLPVDYERFKRGLRAVITSPNKDLATSAGEMMAYTAVLRRDKELAAVYYPNVGWPIRPRRLDSDIDGFRAALEELGLPQWQQEMTDLEKAGKLEEAEKGYLTTKAEKPGKALTLFYIRQGMGEKARAADPAEYRDCDVEKASLDQLYYFCGSNITFGDWEKLKAAGERFDKARPWNLMGKSTLFLAAAHERDEARGAALAQELAAAKIDRPGVKAVQAVIRGEKTLDEITPSFTGNDPHSPANARTLIGYYLTHRQPELARTVIERYLASRRDDQRHFTAVCESFQYGSLASLFPKTEETAKR